MGTEQSFETKRIDHLGIVAGICHEIGLIEAGQTPSHFLDPHLLSKTEQDLLKESFQAVAKLQDASKRHFSRTPF